MYRAIARVSAAILVAFALTNCFQILHYLRANSDGTVSVTWRFSMAAAMKKQMTEKKGPSKGGDNVAGDITKSIFDKEDSLKALLNQFAKGVSIRQVVSEYDVTQEVTFSAKRDAPVPTHDGLPIFPTFKGKQIVFDFEEMAKKNKEKKAGKKEAKKNPNAEKIAALFLSTARYQIVLDGITVKSAYIQNVKSGKKVRIQPTPLGGLTLVDFPFLSALSMEEDGFRLVIDTL